MSGREFYTSVQRYGKHILLKYYSDKYKTPQFKKIRYEPIIFLKAKPNSDSTWTSIDGVQVDPFIAGDMSATDEFLRRYEHVDNFKVYGNNRYVHTFITETYDEEIVPDRSKIKVCNIDIEVASANGFPHPEQAFEEIVAITFKIGKMFYALGLNGDYTPSRKDVEYFRFDDEKDLIRSFISLMKSHRPDIMTGWYINSFDIPYIIRRANNLGMDSEIKALSPWNIIREKFDEEKEGYRYKIYGMAILDYFELYQKFNLKKKENYKLDFICSDELGEKKLDYSEQGSLHLLYLNDFQKFMDYNIRDVELVEKLDGKKNFIDLAIMLAYMTKVNFEDVFHQTRMWDALIYDYLFRREKVYNIYYKTARKDEKFEGAIVKKPLIGRFHSIVSFDATSLYPSLMMMLNVGPDTIVPKMLPIDRDEFLETQKNPHLQTLIDNDWILAANGQPFRRDIKGFLPTIVEYVFNKRQEYKGKMLDAERLLKETGEMKYSIQMANMNTMQASSKVTANSAYGVSGAPSFRFYDIRIAEAVTLTGQLCIRWAAKELNRHLNELKGNSKPKDYVIMADTDSVYLNLEDFVPDDIKNDDNALANYLGEFTKKEIDPTLKATFDILTTQLNAKMQRLHFKREAISKVGIWGDAKKRYALLAIETEGGVRHPNYEQIIKGFEVVRSTTPSLNKPVMKKAIRTMLLGTEKELQKLVSDFKKEFMSAPYQEISQNSSIKGLTKYHDSAKIYGPHCPIQVRGALLYNHHVSEFGLSKKYPKIQEGEKARYIYLKVPNKIGENVITYQSQIPDEFELENKIDRRLMFENTFLNPMQRIADAVNWQCVYTLTLNDL